MAKFYELKGQVRAVALQMLEDRDVAHRQAKKLARQHGARSYRYSPNNMEGFVFSKKQEPDPKLFRRYYDRRLRCRQDWHVPNGSTKEGRAIWKEMRAIHLPGCEQLAKPLGIKLVFCAGGEFRVYTPGLRVWGPRKRVVVILSDHQRPKRSAEIVRLADTEFERLCRRYGDKEAVVETEDG